MSSRECKAKIGYLLCVRILRKSVRAIRSAIGNEMAIMVDLATRCLTPAEAVRRLHALGRRRTHLVRRACPGTRLRRPRIRSSQKSERRSNVVRTGGGRANCSKPSGSDPGLRNAERDEDRWGNRLALRRGPSGDEQHSSLKPLVAWDQCAIDVRNGDGLPPDNADWSWNPILAEPLRVEHGVTVLSSPPLVPASVGMNRQWRSLPCDSRFGHYSRVGVSQSGCCAQYPPTPGSSAYPEEVSTWTKSRFPDKWPTVNRQCTYLQ